MNRDDQSQSLQEWSIRLRRVALEVRVKLNTEYVALWLLRSLAFLERDREPELKRVISRRLLSSYRQRSDLYETVGDGHDLDSEDEGEEESMGGAVNWEDRGVRPLSLPLLRLDARAHTTPLLSLLFPTESGIFRNSSSSSHRIRLSLSNFRHP